ncbi:MAG: aspartate/glutamate racemase family protein [Proteobacteria bacterium]|mgnify:CR=1 FL=1|jgi:allantoin racemase|nr:aspartate/glutamate racemase family protein [Pseudomonadota bacterium]
MSGPIVVINPNSNQVVTKGLSDALQKFRFPTGPAIECLTLAEGPFGIESQLDSDSVVMPLAKLVQARQDAGAFVIACYSDPGLDACRSVSKRPVLGIQECGVLTAMARVDLFGIIAIAEASVARHRRVMARMGVLHRLAAEIPLNMSVDESVRGQKTFERLVETGRALQVQGAGAVILGCAGMARHRAGLEAELGIPVIDPTQAAVAIAMATLLAE